MDGTLANLLACGNEHTPDAEPDMLVVHCPRTVSVMPWDAIAKDLLDWLKAKGWSIHREPDAIVAVTPWRPEVMQ